MPTHLRAQEPLESLLLPQEKWQMPEEPLFLVFILVLMHSEAEELRSLQ